MYHQYVDYSNPATPRVYASSWEVASATSDQDPTLQLPPQQQQDPQQQQQISPSQLQLQQLPPPQLQQPSTPQELVHQLHHQPPHQQYTPHPQTIHVAPTVAQPQYRFETITEEDFAHVHASATGERPGSSRRRGASKPPSLHVDTSRPSSTSAAVASPSALSSAGGGTGPLRVPHSSRTHVQSAHPYRRPQSRAASGSGSGSAAAGVASAQAPVRSRRVSELQSAQTLETSVGGAHAGSAAPLPTVGTAMAVSCPASTSWREGLLGLAGR